MSDTTVKDEMPEGWQPKEYAENVTVLEDEHIVSVTCALEPGELTIICTCGRLKVSAGQQITHAEFTNIASEHQVPGLTV